MSNTDTPQRGSIRKMLRRAPRYLRPYWVEYLIIVVAIFVAESFGVSLAVTPKLLVDEAIVPQAWGRLVAILLGLGGFFLFSTLLNLAADYAIGRAEDEMKKDMRLETFNALQYLPARYFTTAQPGEVTALFARELIIFRDALRTLIPDGYSAIVKLVLAVSALITLDYRLSIALGIALPFVIFIPRAAIRWAAEADFKSKANDGRVAFAVQDSVQSQAIIRAFGLENSELARFRTMLGRGKPPRKGWPGFQDDLKKGFKRNYFLKRLVETLTNVQQILLDGVVLIVGGYMAYNGQMTTATLLTFFPLLSKAGDAVTKLSKFFGGLISAASAVERMDRVFDQAEYPVEAPNAATITSIENEITFDHVVFSHNPDRKILTGINCTIPAGGVTAVVGRSGTGKSTLLHLLIRLYDPIEGKILIDGREIREVKQLSLHQQIGVVLQEPILLNASVKMNLALVNPEATMEEIVEAARSADIHDDIVQLPQGYDTVVGEGGKLLSPGQRQRVTLARALVRNPSLLVLDEPTAALDPQTENAVIETLKRLATRHTLLMVTHRLSSVADLARHVLVLDQGVVAESGTHEELLEKEGIYNRFWQLQSGFTISRDGRTAEISAERLKAVPLFANLEMDMLEKLASQFSATNFDAGQTIFNQGDPGIRFYIIVRGKVAIEFTGFDGKTILLDNLQDGDYFGEIALLQDSPRGATVRAILPTLTLSLERKYFLRLVEQSTPIRQAVEDIAIKRNLSHAARKGRGKSKLSVLDDLVDE